MKKDLILAKLFLKKTADGISMNLLTFRKPNAVHTVDACEHGLGGWEDHRRVWTYIILVYLQGRAHINVLKFRENLLNIWIDMLEKKTKQVSILSQGDSTTAMGWLKCINIKEKDKLKEDSVIKKLEEN